MPRHQCAALYQQLSRPSRYAERKSEILTSGRLGRQIRPKRKNSVMTPLRQHYVDMRGLRNRSSEARTTKNGAIIKYRLHSLLGSLSSL
jgi:hypothetical protein